MISERIICHTDGAVLLTPAPRVINRSHDSRLPLPLPLPLTLPLTLPLPLPLTLPLTLPLPLKSQPNL